MRIRINGKHEQEIWTPPPDHPVGTPYERDQASPVVSTTFTADYLDLPPMAAPMSWLQIPAEMLPPGTKVGDEFTIRFYLRDETLEQTSRKENR